MSIFNFNKKNQIKKREHYCNEAEIFIQVHFVRERDNKRYAFNTLALKVDPERDACNKWYEKHGNPDTFSQITELYLKEKSIKASVICSKYGLKSNVFSTGSGCSAEKWEAIAVCLGLELNIAEARALLKSAGYALTNSSKADLIIRFCLENGIYSLTDINYILKKLCSRSLSEII